MEEYTFIIRGTFESRVTMVAKSYEDAFLDAEQQGQMNADEFLNDSAEVIDWEIKDIKE